MKAMVAVGIVAIATLLFGTHGQRSTTDPRAFVQQQYVHGVPYVEARALGRDAVPSLLSWLTANDMRRWRSNIVVTLGYLGDMRAFKPLVQFLEETTGDLDDDAATFRALLSVPVALGDLGRESSDGAQPSLDYLRERTRPGAWDDRVKWTAGVYRGPMLARQLAGASIHGLGHLASSEALAVLQSLRKTVTAEDRLRNDVEASIAMLQRLRAETPARVFSGRARGVPRTGALPRAKAMNQLIEQPLTFSTHVNVKYTDQLAKNRLTAASKLLFVNNGACQDEVACRVALMLKGRVETFGASGDAFDVIDTPEQLHDVLSKPTDIKIVRMIKWCDGSDVQFLGCTKRGDRSTVIVADAADEVFAHEFGHIKGLDDRENEPCQHFIMDKRAIGTAAVSLTECQAYRVPGRVP